MNFKNIDPKQSIIVTASRRQARFLHEQYQQYQLAQGLEVWDSFEIVPWSAFIERCWQDCLFYFSSPMPIPLSLNQSQQIWHQIVANSPKAAALLNKKQTEKLAFDAWRIKCQWQIEQLEFLPGDQDQAAFAQWQQDYQQKLTDNNWLDPFLKLDYLLDYLSGAAKVLPQTVLFYGFTQKTPQQLVFEKELSKFCQCQDLLLEKPDKAELEFLQLPTAKQELVAAVRWAKEQLQSCKDEDIFEQRIAIVVPELESQKAQLERIIQREFYPEDLVQKPQKDSEKNITTQWHDISIAEPLTEQAMVRTILDLLGFVDPSVNDSDAISYKKIGKAQLQNLLLSPYLYPEQEQHYQACQIELLIRRTTKTEFSLLSLKELLLKNGIKFGWVQSFEKWQQQLPSDDKFSLNQMIEALLGLLSELNWSGYQTLSSREYQLQQVFLEALKQAATLDRVLVSNLKFSQSLSLLRQHLEQQSFHQQQAKAPLQIMGLLEAIDLRFDKVWLLGANDQVLPQKAKPNPFLAKGLQLKYQLPGSSQNRERGYAKAILQSILSNPKVVISYASHEGEQEQMLSPLLMPWLEQSPLTERQLPSELPDYLTRWSILKPLESYQDELGLALADVENEQNRVSGGTGLLKAQAASPFDAYCRYRLGAKPFEYDDLGLSFMERGNLFHKAMQSLWQHLKTQKDLLELNSEQTERLVEQTLETLINTEKKHIYWLNNPSLAAVEMKRLTVLVLEALELDRNRPAFEVVECEARRLINIGGLELQMFIDRIDRLADGSLLIIDYKTGQPKLIDLFKDPIGEPQLLLYAVSEQSLEDSVVGILFMQAHLKSTKYIGVTAQSEMLKGVQSLADYKNNCYSDNFAEAIEEWRKSLTEIATDFKQGKAYLTDFTGNFSDNLSISRWQQRDMDIAAMMKKELGHE